MPHENEVEELFEFGLEMSNDGFMPLPDRIETPLPMLSFRHPYDKLFQGRPWSLEAQSSPDNRRRMARQNIEEAPLHDFRREPKRHIARRHLRLKRLLEYVHPLLYLCLL
jgi:hypothetical protein